MKTTKISGKDFVIFESLLDEFHKNGGTSIDTQLLKAGDSYIFKATVVGERGSFSGHGDADDTNVNKMISIHKCRMAETRAIARALRWYNNIAMTAADEMGGSTTETKPKESIKESIKEPCENCGAEMKMSKAGKAYCSAVCWKQKETVSENSKELPF